MTDPTAAAAAARRRSASAPSSGSGATACSGSASSISEAGDGLTNLTLLLLVNALTGSTAALAGMAIVLAIPPLTIGLVAGTYVDRLDRRRIMLASDLLRAVVVLGFILVGSAADPLAPLRPRLRPVVDRDVLRPGPRRDPAAGRPARRASSRRTRWPRRRGSCRASSAPRWPA